MVRASITLLLLTLTCSSASSHAGNWLPLPSGEITKIAFGSCSLPVFKLLPETKGLRDGGTFQLNLNAYMR